MANYDVGNLIASIQLDVSNLQRDISSATSAFANLGSKIDGMATSVTRSEGYLKNMSSQMGNMRDDMLQYTIAIESAIRSLPATFQQAGTGSAAGMRIMQEGMEAAKATSYTLNTVIAGQLEALTAKVNSQTAQIAASFSRLGNEMRTSMASGFAQVAGGGSLGGIEAKLANMKTGMRGAGTETKTTAGAFDLLADRIKNSSNSFESFTSGAMGKIRGLTTDLFFLQMITQQVGGMFEFAFGQGIKFAIEMENTLIGMGAIISSSMTLDGKDISFSQGMGLARSATQELQAAALKTNLSLEELMGTFQAILGPATQMGMTFEQTKDFAVFGATAVKAMGLRKDQLVQELRSMLTGNITERSSTLATALGITNQDIANAKTQAGGVFAFLQERMAGFVEAAKTSESTFTAIWSNIADGIQQTQAEAFTGLFDRIKQELSVVQGLFFNVVKDEEGKEIVKLNEETVNNFRIVAAYTETIYEDIKNWVSSLMDNDALLSRIHDTFNSIYNLASYVYNNFTSIVESLSLIYAFSGGWLRLISMLVIYFDAVPEVLQFITDHLDTILVIMGLWVGVFSPLGEVFILAITHAATLEAGILAIEVALGVASEASVSATAVMIARFGLVGLAVAGVTAAIYEMHRAMAGNKPVQQQMMAEQGVQNMTLFEQPGEEITPTESAADLKIQEDNQLTNAERKIVESRYKAQNAYLAAVQAMNEMKNKPLASKFGAGDAGKAPKAGRGAGDAVRAEMAEIEGALKEKNAAIKDILDELKYEYQEHDISIKTYFTEAAELTQQLTFNEIDALNQKIAVATKESDVVKYQAELKLKMQQMNKEQIKLLREEAKALKDLDKTLSDYAATAAERSGDFAKAAEIKVNKQYEDVLKGFNAEIITYEANLDSLSVAEKARLVQLKDAVKTIGDIIVSTKTKGALDTINLEQKTAENAQAARKVALDKQLKEGLISEIEYKQGIIDSNNEYANTIESLIPKLEALSLKEGLSAAEKQEYAAAITTLKGKLVELKEPLPAIAKQVKSDFADATASAFEEVIMGTKSVTEAFQSMAKSILASLAKIMAQRAATNIASGLFSIFGGGGSNIGTAWSSSYSNAGIEPLAIAGSANGGEITGPGTATSDSIPAMLSNGEFVIRAASVSKIGKNALEYINNFGSLPKLHYAEGGMVGKSTATSSPFANLKIELINNTGVQAKASTTEPKFNGSEYVMSVVIDGISRNVMGSRDMISALGKRG